MNRLVVLCVVVFFATAIGMLSGLSFGGMIVWNTTTIESQEGLAKLPQLSTEGYAKPSIEMGRYVAQLSHGCKALMLFMDESQTSSIAMGMNKVRQQRPISHDLIEDIMDTFGMELLMVKVERMENGTYYADMLIRHDNRLLQLDSRPSDAIAVAMRLGAPVLVKQELFEEYGMNIC